MFIASGRCEFLESAAWNSVCIFGELKKAWGISQAPLPGPVGQDLK
jgi:hypothetical protein